MSDEEPAPDDEPAPDTAAELRRVAQESQTAWGMCSAPDDLLLEAAAKIERMEAALRFYRDAWTEVGVPGDIWYLPDEALEADQGKRAREALGE